MVAKTQLTGLIAINETAASVAMDEDAATEAMHAAIVRHVVTHVDGRWSAVHHPGDDGATFRLAIPPHVLAHRYIQEGAIYDVEWCPDMFDIAMDEADGWDALFAPLRRAEWSQWLWSWESITLEGHTLTIQAIAQYDRDAAAHEADVRAWDRYNDHN